MRIKITLQNGSPSDSRCRLETRLLDAQGRTVGTLQTDETVGPNSTRDVSQETTLASPHLWSPDSPYLYRARTEVMLTGHSVDICETRFGIRWFEFTADRGFFLNGAHLQLRGMCLHHDFGGLGVALPDRANEKTVEIMKQMGCNFLGSAHNEAAPALLEACDRLGLLV